MSESAALLAAIRQAPDDDAPRLIYADWLDEHGQPERAEFIRVQIELARNDSPILRKREAELLAEHHDLFAGIAAREHFRFRFKRGFVSGFGHSGAFVTAVPTSPRMALVFRFYPDRLALFGLAMGPVDLWVRRANFDRKNSYYSRGMYILSPPKIPIAIEFECKGRLHDRGISCVGDFAGAFLTLGVRYANSAQPFTADFQHLEIDGFDSRQDSP